MDIFQHGLNVPVGFTYKCHQLLLRVLANVILSPPRRVTLILLTLGAAAAAEKGKKIMIAKRCNLCFFLPLFHRSREEEREERERKIQILLFPPSVAGTLSAQQQQSRKCKDWTQDTRVPPWWTLAAKIAHSRKDSRAPHFLPIFSPADRPTSRVNRRRLSVPKICSPDLLYFYGGGLERVWPSERQSACLNICGRVNYIVWPQTDGADVHFSPSIYC